MKDEFIVLRIIHVVENLDKGAVENWLVNIFLESRKMQPQWEWTFYCILGKKGRLDDKVLAAGGHIVYSPCTISDKYSFLKHFRKTLRQGKYDIIHSHHDYLSGFYLLATAGLSFKKRILHIHNTDKALPVGNAFVHKVLLPVFGKLAIWFSDLIVGISNDTLQEFTGKKRFKYRQTTVLYYGIDLTGYANNPGKQWLRKELGIPANAHILLFVGRMNAQKNPVFLVDILKEIVATRPDVYAVFVGKGDKEQAVMQKSNALHIDDKVKLLGWRNDIAAIMQAADVFVFPRVEYPKEGLGLVVVEAQAAGLPMVLSHGIVEDAIVINELAAVVGLNNNAAEWAGKILNILGREKPISQEEAYERMRQSHFELRNGTNNLLALYQN